MYPFLFFMLIMIVTKNGVLNKVKLKLPGSNFSHIDCFFFLVSFRTSKFKELQFADVVSSAIPLFPEEESDWVAFQSKKEKN